MLMAVEAQKQIERPHRQRADERLEEMLMNWVRWMHGGGMSDFHVKCRSVGQGFKHYDTDSSYIELDARLAKAVDTIVTHDLKSLERDAINSEYLDAVWPHAVSIHPVLVIARQAVRMGLQRRSLWVDEA